MNKKIEKNIKIGIVILAVAAAAFWGFSKINKSDNLPDSNNQERQNKIISNRGIHWHSEIKIKILGENQKIPSNIGLGAVHSPLHTHDDSGVIHLEFKGIVSEKDIKLKKFFEVWEKQFNSNCIFDKCNGEEGRVKMLVNGSENSEFENYMMKDKDKIEIIFEKNN